ncbi:hypothetical protein VPH35_109516 [Triticum aestivum]
MRRQGCHRHVGIRRDGAQPEPSRSPLLTLFARLTRAGKRIGSRAPARPRCRCRMDSLAAASSYLRHRRRESAPPLPSGISSRQINFLRVPALPGPPALLDACVCVCACMRVCVPGKLTSSESLLSLVLLPCLMRVCVCAWVRVRVCVGVGVGAYVFSSSVDARQ